MPHLPSCPDVLFAIIFLQNNYLKLLFLQKFSDMKIVSNTPDRNSHVLTPPRHR